MRTSYKVGNIVTGCVTGIEKYGIFVSLDDYYSGLIHISEISKLFVRNVNDYVTIGETIKAKILEVDEENCHLKLSIKDLDYRISRKNRRKIKETPNGFDTLKECMSVWLKEKQAEIMTKTKEN